MSATPLAADPVREDFSRELAGVALFSDLAPAILKAISDLAVARGYLAGEDVFTLGQFDASEFLFVRAGRLKASCADGGAGSMLIEIVRKGEFFGLADALSGEKSAHAEFMTVSAEEDSELLAIDAEAFRALAGQRPSLARNLMQYFAAAVVSSRFRDAAADASPQRRIFAALMELVARDALTGDWRIERMPKHRELAEKADADEAVAANAVAQLILQGVARRDYPGLVIVDMARLNRLAS